MNMFEKSLQTLQQDWEKIHRPMWQHMWSPMVVMIRYCVVLPLVLLLFFYLAKATS